MGVRGGLCVANKRLMNGLALANALLMFGLSFHYSEVVHGSVYVGNPNHGKVQRARRMRELRLATEALEKFAEMDSITHPAGRLADAAFVA